MERPILEHLLQMFPASVSHCKNNNMMKKVLYSILVIGMFTMPLVAKDLKGVLVNEKQKPIAGMKLWVKNTMNSE